MTPRKRGNDKSNQDTQHLLSFANDFYAHPPKFDDPIIKANSTLPSYPLNTDVLPPPPQPPIQFACIRARAQSPKPTIPQRAEATQLNTGYSSFLDTQDAAATELADLSLPDPPSYL